MFTFWGGGELAYDNSLGVGDVGGGGVGVRALGLDFFNFFFSNNLIFLMIKRVFIGRSREDLIINILIVKVSLDVLVDYTVLFARIIVIVVAFSLFNYPINETWAALLLAILDLFISFLASSSFLLFNFLLNL